MGTKKSFWTRNWICLLLVFLSLSAFYVQTVLNLRSWMWDFETYYYATQAFERGLNPYDITNLQEIAEKQIEHKFVYLPLTIYLLMPLTWLSPIVSKLFYLTIGSIIMLATTFFWMNKTEEFSGIESLWSWVFVVLLLLAFKNPFFIPMRAGNIALFTNCLLLLGLILFIEGRINAYYVLILFASLFKLLPVIFVTLPLLLKKRYWKKSIVSVCLLGTFVLVNYILYPEYSLFFFKNAISATSESGPHNISTYAYIMKILFYTKLSQSALLFYLIVYLIYASCVLAVINFTFRVSRSLQDRLMPLKYRLELTLIGILSYALIVPRFKDYNLILLIFPIYLLLMFRQLSSEYIILFVSITTSYHLVIPGMKALNYNQILGDFSPLLITALVWVAVLIFPTELNGVQQIEKKDQTNSGSPFIE